MKAPQAPTTAQREKAARAPLTLEQAAAELADLGITREVLKAFATSARLVVYRLGTKRLVQRQALADFRAWAERKIDEDPEWLAIEAQRMRGRHGNTRRVVTGVGAPPPRVVSLASSSTLPAREAKRWPASPSMKLARVGDAPRPVPPRIVAQGKR